VAARDLTVRAGRTAMGVAFWYGVIMLCLFAVLVIGGLFFASPLFEHDPLSDNRMALLIGGTLAILVVAMALGGWLGERLAARWRMEEPSWWVPSSIAVALFLAGNLQVVLRKGALWADGPLGGPLMNTLLLTVVLAAPLLAGQALGRGLRRRARDIPGPTATVAGPTEGA